MLAFETVQGWIDGPGWEIELAPTGLAESFFEGVPMCGALLEGSKKQHVEVAFERLPFLHM
jgi:hypothetical protein